MSGAGEAAGATRRLVVDLRAVARRWALPRDGADAIRQAAPPGWAVQVMDTPAIADGDGRPVIHPDLAAAVREAEAYFGFGASAALVDAAPRLRWIQSGAVGVGSLPRETMAARGIVLTNAAGVMAVPIAEYVVGGVLHFLRGFDVAALEQRTATWNRAPWVAPVPEGLDADPREAGECRAVIVGVRGIGAAVAQRLSAFGAECVGVRRRPDAPPPPGFARVVGADALDDELPGADVVVLAAPSTAETAGLLDAARIARLPRRAIVVNVGRGSLVDEPALVAALRAGALRGAVLDVFAEEPLPAGSPLWHLPNVLVTPHVSGTSPGRFWGRLLPLFLDNWARWQRGAPLRNVVDLAAGY